MHISLRSYFFLLLWFSLIALCSQLTPYFANDYRYFFIQGSDELVSSFADILLSQYHHYFAWGGRSLAHTLAQTMLWIGKPYSSIIQAFVYIALILFIYYVAYGVRPTLRLRWRPIVVISALLFLQLRAYGEVIFNLVSSANYLYTTLIVLIFLLPYRLALDHPLKLKPLVLYPLVMITGFCSGWSVENTAAAVAVMGGLYLIFAYRRGFFAWWQLCGYGSFLCGFALLVLAPGNSVRYQNLLEHRAFDYSEHLIRCLGIAGETLILSAVLLAMLAYVGLIVWRKSLAQLSSQWWRTALFFLGLATCSLGVMIFAPNFPARACTSFTIFSVIALLALAELVLQQQARLISVLGERVLIRAAVLVISLLIFNMLWGLVLLHQEQGRREAQVWTQQRLGQQEIVVDAFSVRSYRYLYVADVREQADFWTNQIVSHYLGVKSIVRTCSYPPHHWAYDAKFMQFFDKKQCQAVTTKEGKERE